ncbi:MAG: YkgJ family cysteine cluster protein [Thermoleophilia bacterium]
MATLNNKAVVPTKFELHSKIKFRCHKDIACFTRCCRNIDILLTPYDIVRMKQRLELSSKEVLTRYTRYEVDEKTTHPLLFLRMNDDEERNCPFVKPKEGCTIYSDRPAACRYYPVGQATHRRLDDDDKTPIHDEWYVVVKEEHCQGFEEEKVWTIAEWREDQEAALYDDMNREWKNIMMKQDIPKDKIDEKRQQMFYMASYDMDGFRRFVFESRFLEVAEIDPDSLEKMKGDDVELMKFGFDYLKYLFGISKTIRVKRAC